MTQRPGMAGWSALCWLLWALWAPGARADDTVAAYAIVIGSNLGGEGQEPLHFAEDDARRFAQVLQEIGHVPASHLLLMLSPRVLDVQRALVDVKMRLEAESAAGRSTQLTFYYSGHARADAANLGHETLPLSELRSSLEALDTSLTVVVLDACQSGAFSGVKGASPAADFSFNSVERLNTEGLAVMASSTGGELSQESETLAASYFTHHLLTAMRGAGDENQDGRVSLDETYRYAYDRTLSDTARTRIGGQHVTLEMDVKGRGDVALTYPGEANARLVLERSLSGTVLVQQAGGRAVMAEVVKTPTAPLQLALPPGDYDAVVRREQRVFECPVHLANYGSETLDVEDCDELSLDEWHAKGEPPPPPRELWFLELGFGASFPVTSPYTRRLEDFDFSVDEQATGYVRLTGGAMLHRLAGVTLGYELLSNGVGDRSLRGPEERVRDEIGWSAHRVAVGGRVAYPALGRWLVLYGGASVGMAFAITYYNRDDEEIDHEVQYALSGDAVLGLQTNVSRWFGLFVEGGYGWAPVPENLLGDRHNAAGFRLLTGVRVRKEGVW